MNKSNVISFKVSEKTQEMMSEELDWCKREKTPNYAKWQAKDGDTVITLYESGKVVFQGKDADLASDFWIQTEKINSGKVDVKDAKTNSKKESDQFIDKKIFYSSSIGSDEVGTGDFFGPVVVCASYVSKENINLLKELGIKDSKKLTDDKIIEIVPKIKEIIPYECIILNNEQYNEYYSKEINLNKIKAILHNKVLSKMKKKIPNYDYIVVDQFAKRDTYFGYLKDQVDVTRDITFLTKGEDKCMAVAVASIICRYIFLSQMNNLSNKIGFILPKGANDSVNEIAKKIYDEKGLDGLRKVAKLNFKTADPFKEK